MGLSIRDVARVGQLISEVRWGGKSFREVVQIVQIISKFIWPITIAL